MNSVGIDVSKGKSIITVMRPFGEVVISPFEIHHTNGELCELAKLLRSLPGETRVVMEATGNYHLPIAWMLNDSGFYVSVVNAMLVHNYGNNSLRRAKTDKKDAIKLANYGLDHLHNILLFLNRISPFQPLRKEGGCCMFGQDFYLRCTGFDDTSIQKNRFNSRKNQSDASVLQVWKAGDFWKRFPDPVR